ncbi:fasciclin domain-containing protein [Palleronia sediminis]|nr:fasciclin domain-containing protein [Palleronia sediminis]
MAEKFWRMGRLVVALSTTGLVPVAGLAQENLATDSRLSTFNEAMRAAGLEDRLRQTPLTIFAPTDEAFERLPQAVSEGFTDPDNADALREVLDLHLVPGGPHEADDIPVDMQTVSGARLVVTYTDGALTMRVAPPDNADELDTLEAARGTNEARIVFGDVSGGPGVLAHGIDRVLLPPDFALDDGAASDADPQTAEAVAGAAPQPTGNGEPADTDETSPETEGQDAVAATLKPVDDMPDGVEPEPGDSDTGSMGDAGTETADTPRSDTPEPDMSGQEGVIVATDPAPVAENTVGDTAPAGAESGAGEPTPASDTEVIGADAERSEPHDTAGESGDRASDVNLTSELVSADELLGKPVRGADGDDIGIVGDLLFSLDGARIVSLVVELDGGFFELGAPDTRRVDIGEISVDPLDGAVILSEGAE